MAKPKGRKQKKLPYRGLPILPRVGVIIAVGVAIGNLAALVIAFLAGMKYAKDKQKDAAISGCLCPEMFGETTGLKSSGQKMPEAEKEWDKDSGVL